MCICRGDMWLLCVSVKKASFHPVNRYSLFVATNVYHCVKAHSKDQCKVE